MGELTIAVIAVTILAVCGMVGVTVVKAPTANKAIFILLAILTIGISAMGAMALPSNYGGKQILAWSWGAIAIVGTVLSFMSTKYTKASKYVLILATLGALISLILI